MAFFGNLPGEKAALAILQSNFSSLPVASYNQALIFVRFHPNPK